MANLFRTENNVVVETMITNYNVPTLKANGFIETSVEDIAAYVGWIWDGNNFIEPPAESADNVTTRVTLRQARLALLEMRLLDSVEAAITIGPQEWQIEWEYATWVDRDSDLVQGLGAAMGLTSEQLDALFELAGSK